MDVEGLDQPQPQGISILALDCCVFRRFICPLPPMRKCTIAGTSDETGEVVARNVSSVPRAWFDSLVEEVAFNQVTSKSHRCFVTIARLQDIQQLPLRLVR